WMQDNKFRFVQLLESKKRSNSSNEGNFKGFFSRFKIAEFENIPVDSPLLQFLWAKLPSISHSDPDWAATGELEYYYVSTLSKENSNSSEHSVQLQQEGAAKVDVCNALCDQENQDKDPR
ncbi:MAG: hypothetical protein ACKPKO_61435, partial [Candidatus Fonsibacter sp.]